MRVSRRYLAKCGAGGYPLLLWRLLGYTSTKRLFGCFVIRLGRDADATTGLAPVERMFGHYLAIPRASAPTRLARVERMFP